MKVKETFGEISFLIGGNGASAFVVAEEEVELTVIEGYYINALFNVNPQFAGRFYKYLAFLLAHRIKQRQKQ
jgi:CRP-like cAMP-binding protein